MHIWAERYDRVMDDIFAVQDEITVSVLAALELSWRRDEIERVKRERPNSLDAYDLVLRALPFLHVYMPASIEPAISLLSKALEIEPDYSAAHAQLARCFHIRFSRGGLHEEDRAASVQHARAAMASDDPTTLAFAALVIWFDDQQPVKFELAINLKSAKSMGITLDGNIHFPPLWASAVKLELLLVIATTLQPHSTCSTAADVSTARPVLPSLTHLNRTKKLGVAADRSAMCQSARG
jgi:hypothetical protein